MANGTERVRRWGGASLPRRPAYDLPASLLTYLPHPSACLLPTYQPAYCLPSERPTWARSSGHSHRRVLACGNPPGLLRPRKKSWRTCPLAHCYGCRLGALEPRVRSARAGRRPCCSQGAHQFLAIFRACLIQAGPKINRNSWHPSSFGRREGMGTDCSPAGVHLYLT